MICSLKKVPTYSEAEALHFAWKDDARFGPPRFIAQKAIPRPSIAFGSHAKTIAFTTRSCAEVIDCTATAMLRTSITRKSNAESTFHIPA